MLSHGDPVTTTPCGHAFHTICLDRWLLSKNTCAVCRQVLGDADRFVACVYNVNATNTDGVAVCITADIVFDTKGTGTRVDTGLYLSNVIESVPVEPLWVRLFVVRLLVRAEAMQLRVRLAALRDANPAVAGSDADAIVRTMEDVWYRYLTMQDASQ